MKWFGEILLAVVLGLALAALLTASAAYGVPGLLGATAGSSSSVRPPWLARRASEKTSIWQGKPQANIRTHCWTSQQWHPLTPPRSSNSRRQMPSHNPPPINRPSRPFAAGK